MSNQRFDVVLTGKLAPGINHEIAVASFAARFGISEEKAAAAINGKPIIVSRNADATAAKTLLDALTQIGILCTLDPVIGGVAPAPAAAPRPAAPAPAAAAAPAPRPMPKPVAVPSATPAAAPPPMTAPADGRGWAHRIEGQPDFAFITVKVPAEQTIRVEASAMATMDTHLVMKTRLGGGFARLLTGESIFVNEFTAQGGPGEIGIAPGAPGDVRHLYLDNQTVYLQNSGYVASGPGVTIESKWQGFTKGFFSGENLFLIRAQGTGDLWFSSYGGIIELDINSDYVVDTGNIVGFTDGLQYSITKVGGYKSLFFSGEGLVCRFSGSGKVWIQTRKPGAFARWAHPYRPVEKRS